MSEYNPIGTSPRLQTMTSDVRQSSEVLENMETSFYKMDDSMEHFVVDFRKREEKFEDELRAKDELIR